MIKLNDNNIIVGYIKELLHEFNLPKARLDINNKFENCHYINKNQLYVCEKDGSLKSVKSYKYGDPIINITKNLNINNNIYDNYTHYYLGDYLRFQRDYLGIDLMSLYNCFCYDSPSEYNVEIIDTNKNKIDEFRTDNSNYSIFMVPVRFGKEYTIGIDCSTSISCCCDFYDNGKRIDIDSNKALYNSTYRKFTGLRLSKPFNGLKPILFTTPNVEKNNFMYESVLKLFIKVPSQSKSSIVILEGDYTKGCNIIINENGTSSIGDKLFTYKTDGELLGNYDYTTKPSLLSINTGEKILVADRLIEYLLFNVITKNSSPANIKKLQSRLIMSRKDLNNAKLPSYLPYVGYYGIWDENIRKALYRFISDNNLNSKYNDVLSYLDKDIEKELGEIE